MYQEYLDDHIHYESSLDEVRLKMFAEENGTEPGLVIRLLRNYSVEQVVELIVIPDFYYRIKEFVDPDFSSAALGFIRDLVYFDYNPCEFNIAELDYKEIMMLRSRLGVKNISDLFMQSTDYIAGESIVKQIKETTEDEVGFDDFDDFFDFLDGGMLNNDIEDFFNDSVNEVEVSDDEYYIRESKCTYREYLNSHVLSNAILINSTDERAIFERIDEREYYDRFFNGNIRLAVHIAQQYTFSFNHMRNDLIQSGLLGIINAMKSFDASLGYKFSTYSVNHIRQQVLRYIQDFQSVIRIPVHKREELYKVNRLISDYKITNFTNPSLYKISKELEITKDELDERIKLINLSCDFADISNDELVELFDKHNYDPTSEYILLTVLRDELRGYLKEILNEREYFVISERFGINDENRERTLEEVGIMLGVTRERIRQIEVKTIRRLRKNVRIVDLFDILKI